MLTRVHHVGLVVRRLEDGIAFWQDVLGLHVSKQATVRDQGVRAALLSIGRSGIELLEPIGADGGVAKFLERRGEGLHHVCFETPDVAAELAGARAKGLPLIDEAPRQGLAGMICFLHPKGTRGVLVELATPPPGEHPPAAASTGPLAGLALEEVTARSRDAASAADLFAGQLGLAREACGADAGLAAAAVSAGSGRPRPPGRGGRARRPRPRARGGSRAPAGRAVSRRAAHAPPALTRPCVATHPLSRRA